MVVWKNDNYQLIVNVFYQRINTDEEETVCRICGGTGLCYAYMEVGMETCDVCNGRGKIYKLAEIPPPPEVDQKFLEELRSFINRYEK